MNLLFCWKNTVLVRKMVEKVHVLCHSNVPLHLLAPVHCALYGRWWVSMFVQGFVEQSICMCAGRLPVQGETRNLWVSSHELYADASWVSTAT